MTSELWTRADRLLAQALELPAAEQRAFVDQACGDDEALRRESLALLAADRAADRFLERPLVILSEAPRGDENLLEDRLGPYRLLRILGQGGMATVYLAARADRAYRQHVAIKLIRTDIQAAEARERFRIERQILAQLNHPAIAQLFDGGTTPQGNPYLVMEYVDGTPIDDFCDRHQLSVEARLQLFRQVCAAVEHAHRNLLVHRDLKPANILVTADGQPKLLDFGIAKLLDGEALSMTVAQTRSGLRPMTPLYASPEQVAGKAITTASDVYALGVLLYRLLTGQNPYGVTRARPSTIEQKILAQEPERPSEAVGRTAADGVAAKELQKRLRGDLDNILLMALEKEPARRYGSVEQLSADIARHLGNQPVAARTNTVGYRLGKFLRRNALAVTAACSVAILLLGFALFTRLQSVQLAQQRDLAREERKKARQVSDFLMELFAEADPSNARGERLTVREVLDRGRDEIDRLAAQPAVQAAQLNTIGKVYMSLGHYQEATPLLENALRLRREVHGSTHIDVAESLTDLSMLMQKKGQHRAAIPLARQALAVRRGHFGARHPEVADALSHLAFMLHNNGDYEDAETLYRQALKMGREILGEQDPLVAGCLNDLANLLIDTSDYDEAETLLRASLATNRQAYGEIHPEVAGSLNNLAYLFGEKGDFDAAEARYRESIQIKRKLYVGAHHDLAGTLNNLAFVLYEKGNLEDAEPLFREALAMDREIHGEHPAVARDLNNLALLLRDRGDLDNAELLMRQALAMQRKLLGADHPMLTTYLYNLALVLRAKGAYEQAEPLYRETLARDRRDFGDAHPNFAISSTALAHVLHDQDKNAEAEPLLRRAIQIYREKLPAGHWRAAHGESLLGACLTALGRYQEAEPLLLASHAALEEHVGQNEARIREVLSLIIKHYETRGMTEQADAYRAQLNERKAPS